MSISRRAVASALAFPLVAGCQPQEHTEEVTGAYPSKDITFIIPVASGGGFDILSRFIAGAMEEALPHRVNIVPFNVPSGGGGKGVNQLFRARPDGYTIGILNVPGIFVLQRVREVPYDFGNFSWIGTVTMGGGYGLAVSSRSNIQTYDDLVALSRQRPVTFAATGPEGTAHAVTRIATSLLGIRARMVTGYRSSTDYSVGAMRGDTDAVIAAAGVLDRLPDGLRVIATFDTDSKRPGIPNAADLGRPELTALRGLRTMAAPPDTPREVIEILNRALYAIESDSTVNAWARQNDSVVDVMSPEETVEMVRIRRETLRYMNDA